jgi:hypothetical protein
LFGDIDGRVNAHNWFGVLLVVVHLIRFGLLCLLLLLCNRLCDYNLILLLFLAGSWALWDLETEVLNTRNNAAAETSPKHLIA